MKIVLLRHGKPDIPEHGKLHASEVYQWVESYNTAGLVTEHKPSREAIEIAHSCNKVVCSNLPRSVESAHMLGFNEVDFIEPVFKEMALPHGSFPSPKLSPNFWAVLFRALWFLGYSPKGESLKEARLRATAGADRLQELAVHNGSVLLVGHGFINRFIAKELLSNGWQGPVSPGKKYWEFGVYEHTI